MQAIYAVLFFIVLTVALCVLVFAITFIVPRYKAMLKGTKYKPVFRPGFQVCCPPGLGCNEPGSRVAKCRRMLAESSVTHPDERMELDRLWSEYWLNPCASTLLNFASYRDDILEKRMTQMANLHIDTKELLSGDNPAEVDEQRIEVMERVVGEVLEGRKNSKTAKDYEADAYLRRYK